MNTTIKSLIAGVIAVTTLSMGAAQASERNAADSYSDSGVSFSITFGNGTDYDSRYNENNRNYRGNDRGRRNGYSGRNSRVVNRKVFQTRYRARIVLIEEVVRTRSGPRLLCTVDAKGREAGYVPRKRLKRVARKNCSRRSQIRIVA